MGTHSYGNQAARPFQVFSEKPKRCTAPVGSVAVVGVVIINKYSGYRIVVVYMHGVHAAAVRFCLARQGKLRQSSLPSPTNLCPKDFLYHYP